MEYLGTMAYSRYTGFRKITDRDVLELHCICISLDVNFNESLTNDVVSFEQLGPV